MKTLIGKRLTSSVSSVGSMLLLLIFAVCSLIMIGVGAATYSRISEGSRSSFSSSAAVRYVTNKIRSGDRIVIENGGKGLAVYSGDTVCVIMTDDGGIGERTVSAESYRDYVGGDIIFEKTSLEVTEDNGMYKVTAASDDDVCTVYCRSKG